MSKMRAKLLVTGVQREELDDGSVCSETLKFSAVGGKAVEQGYPEDGTDEDNNYARWSPCADLTITIQNPALFGEFSEGQKFYVDFTEAPE